MQRDIKIYRHRLKYREIENTQKRRLKDEKKKKARAEIKEKKSELFL